MDQFVFGWSEPVYEFSWVQNSVPAGYEIDVRIRQKQSTGLVTMPIDVLMISGASDSTTQVVWNDKIEQTFKLASTQSVTDVQLDPDEWILRTINEVPVASEPNIRISPNPFNGATTVSFETQVAGSFDITIYNLRGAKVRDLASGTVAPGFHPFVWDGRNGAGQEVASGVYFVRLRTPQGEALSRAVFLK